MTYRDLIIALIDLSQDQLDEPVIVNDGEAFSFAFDVGCLEQDPTRGVVISTTDITEKSEGAER